MINQDKDCLHCKQLQLLVGYEHDCSSYPQPILAVACTYHRSHCNNTILGNLLRHLSLLKVKDIIYLSTSTLNSVTMDYHSLNVSSKHNIKAPQNQYLHTTNGAFFLCTMK